MSAIKECFTSRFPNGVILESDFSQLEVVGLAALSNDPVLIEDLLAGRDMHRYYTAQRLGITEEEVTDRERKFTKKMTFQLQYGSGAKGMALKLQLPQEQCQAFIEAYYTRYKRVKEWQDEVYAAVVASRAPSTKLTKSGDFAGRGEYVSATGRTYHFYEMDAPEWKKDKTPSFLPPQVKNYPVQGFATGDLMALFRARLFRWWVGLGADRFRVLPINTVHDNVMWDLADKEEIERVVAVTDGIAERLVQDVENLWGVKCPVPFKIESKYGPTWADMRKV